MDSVAGGQPGLQQRAPEPLRTDSCIVKVTLVPPEGDARSFVTRCTEAVSFRVVP
jgi:hypothetical protein